MIYFLIVVSVGGTSSITGPLLAALLLGIADVAGKYFIPKMGAFTVYLLMILILMWRPQGLFTRKGGRVMDFGQQSPLAAQGALAAVRIRASGRWPSRCRCVVPSHALMVNEIAIVALFAMSLDLILGYTGIVSLGHAAFFGFGAYAAALFAKHVMPDPTVGLVVAIVLPRVAGRSWRSVTILRGTDLTRLMVTLGTALLLLELANKLDWLTGGADGLQGVVMGPVLGLFEFDLYGRTAAWYSLAVMLLLFLADAPAGAFAVRRHAQGHPRQPAARHGDRHSGRVAAGGDLHRGGRHRRRRGCAAGADHRLRLARRAGLRPLGRRAADAGHRRRGLALWRHGGRHRLQAAAGPALSAVTPQYWMFWIGLILVLLVLVGRDRLLKPWTWFGWAARRRAVPHERHRAFGPRPGDALRRHHGHQQRDAGPASAVRATR